MKKKKKKLIIHFILENRRSYSPHYKYHKHYGTDFKPSRNGLFSVVGEEIYTLHSVLDNIDFFFI